MHLMVNVVTMVNVLTMLLQYHCFLNWLANSAVHICAYMIIRQRSIWNTACAISFSIWDQMIYAPAYVIYAGIYAANVAIFMFEPARSEANQINKPSYHFSYSLLQLILKL